MDIFSLVIAIISLLASLVTLFAVWGNVSDYFYNLKHFKEGGLRITYYSGAYNVSSGLAKVLIYNSSAKDDDYFLYRGDGRNEMYEEIKPFKEWLLARKFDDIRVPSYPLRLL